MAETGTNMETWKNDMAGYIGLKRFDHRGELTRYEMVEGGRIFHITPEERRLNSDAAATEEQDMFKNGRLTPVRLIEDSDEARELAANPNVLSESDMRTMLKSHWKQFESRVNAIGNPGTLERLLAMAHEEDATIKKVETIKSRMVEIAPSLYSDNPTEPLDPGGMPTMPRPVTPR